MHGNNPPNAQPNAMPNAQPHWDLSVYDPLVKRTAPNTLSAARKAAVTLENAIRFDGSETGAFYGAAGNLITRKVGTSNHVRFDQHELMGTNGSLFTHNHPNGLPFSPHDVEFAVQLGLVEVRAVTTYCRYILQPNGTWPSWQSIESAFRRHIPAARQDVCALVQSSQLANGDIDKEFLHRLWVLTSNELQLKYTREAS